MASPTCTVVDQQVLAKICWIDRLRATMEPKIPWFHLQLWWDVDASCCECRKDSTFMAWWNLAWTWHGVPCIVSLFPPAFSRPGVSGRTSRQDNRAWNFCKASQPHLGIPLVPSVKQMLSYFQFPRMILSHCRRERPRKTLLQKSLWMTGALSLARALILLQPWNVSIKHEPEEAGPGSKIQRLSCGCGRNWLSITFMVFPKALDLRLSDFICWHQAWTRSSCFGEPRWKRIFADKELGEPFPLVRNRVTEVAGMKKEIESMVSFDVFSEVPCRAC